MKNQFCGLIFTLFFGVITFVNNFTLGQPTTITNPPQKAAAIWSQKKAPFTKTEIAVAQALLSALGYWLDRQASGLDDSLRHALIAFQKIEGRALTGNLTSEEIAALRTASFPQPRETGYAHIEVDLARQVLFVVDYDDMPLRILPISSGSGEWFTEGGRTRRAITPTGRFKVTWQIKGWRKSPLGLLYYPNYIYNGIAIHGNPAVPVYPASHGCIRIPMFAAKEFSEIAGVGTEVLVYDDATDVLPR
jgi:hypothetical protein